MHTKLVNNLSQRQINDLVEVGLRYKELDEETLFNYLWKMTYDPEYALGKAGLADKEFLQLYKKVRNYLFEVYGKPEILGNPEEYNQELFVALEQDKFAYTFICKKLYEAIRLNSKNELERLNTLLNSDMGNNRFGGLRALGLNLSEAQFFENYEKAFPLISSAFTEKLQEALYNNLIKETSEEVTKNLEVIKENKNDDKVLIDLFSKCVENKEDLLKLFENIAIMYSKYGIHFEKFLSGYEFFKEYMSLFENIKEKGIDINWLNQKSDAIEQLLR